MTISKMASSNSPHEWTKNEIDDLVTYYQEEDILWNLSSKDYHHKDKRRVAFQRISEKMGISGKLKILFIHSFHFKADSIQLHVNFMIDMRVHHSSMT